ncbi:MAG: hypothetical protein OHK0052_13490 [Anaerolineales bacterium]
MTIPSGPILLVEDVPNILELLSVTLRFHGYPIITATNGVEGLQQVEREKPALVISDILMPQMDGYAMVYRLRTNPLTRHIPIIFLSATYVTPEDKEFGINLGAIRFLEKPVDIEELLASVREALTQPLADLPSLPEERQFYINYQKRLESKLRQKNVQINRTERMLETLPEDQKPAYTVLLSDTRRERDQIQRELDQLYEILKQYTN